MFIYATYGLAWNKSPINEYLSFSIPFPMCSFQKHPMIFPVRNSCAGDCRWKGDALCYFVSWSEWGGYPKPHFQQGLRMVQDTKNETGQFPWLWPPDYITPWRCKSILHKKLPGVYSTGRQTVDSGKFGRQVVGTWKHERSGECRDSCTQCVFQPWWWILVLWCFQDPWGV